MHDRQHPDTAAILAIYDTEWKAAAVGPPKPFAERAAKSRSLPNHPQNTFHFFKELTAQAGRLLLVERNGLGVLCQGVWMKSDYHPNRARMLVSASSTGIA